MNNSKLYLVTSISLFITTACIRSKKRWLSWKTRRETTDTQEQCPIYNWPCCSAHRLSFLHQRFTNSRINVSWKSVMICFIEFIIKVLKERWANITCRSASTYPYQQLTERVRKKLAASQDFEVERHESTLTKGYPKSMIQQLTLLSKYDESSCPISSRTGTGYRLSITIIEKS